LGPNPDLDHVFPVDGAEHSLNPTKLNLIAELESEGTKMTVFSTQPAVHVYTANELQDNDKEDKH
jgi:galactose mutarotase-like enzyme